MDKTSSVNKKIINATPFEFNGISFRSKLEVRIYKALVEAGYNPMYEGMTFIVSEGYYPTLPCYDVFYDRKLKTKRFGNDKIKVQAITYTPDFILYKDDILIVIEAKGRENDVFPLKKKLFRKWMESYYKLTGKTTIYFEIFNKKQTVEAINIINQL